ncbi:homeodomain-interacting protein kinase 2-like isoform X1 [Thunnus maccoyii]|uniref:homeodomain-interacting protein kinase 2-like isoform X1 n=1 Tax=Thunnus maccoyii TaxID=8240 RepID=UPI001C4B3864|nr:homeodomain-interacting protein kinase 2-like isoform X1 [Thunnus maccoyii]XP_042246976.1 homeodomain-interacting protein kinase 2-like isoform X1 [Thunnus maccoyii]
MEDNNTQDTEGDLFSSASSDYKAQKFLGCGTFGEVLQCRNLTTNETVALKFIRHERHVEEAKHEEALLKKIQSLNSNKFNIVRWIDSFTYEGLYCLEFEKLDISLLQFVQTSPSECLELKEIRPILQQLATAMQFLASTGIVHADLKLDNIMMVDHLRQPLRVKVIDFGLAFPVSEAMPGSTLQAQWYRSPEILLGAPFNEAIDIWSLGCIAAEMFMGNVLFPGKDEYDMMRHMVYTVGKPPDHLLSAGLYSFKYFNAMYLGQTPIQWRFKSSLEARHFIFTPRTINSLNDLLEHNLIYELSREDAEADQCDRASFVDLLTRLLKVDMSERITPSQILQHPFITMTHLEGFNNSLHVQSCSDLMSVCQSLSLDDGEDVAESQTCVNDRTSNSTASPAQHSVTNEGHPAGLSGEKRPQSPDISGESSQVKKRKRDGADKSADCGNRTPDTSPAKKSRTGCLDPVPAETKSLQQKRKRDDTDLCTSFDNSPAKKSWTGCRDPVPAETKSLQQKRKRDDTDLCTSFDNSPAKRICPDISGESSQVKKRKRDGADKSADCDNRTPDTSPAEKSRTGCLDPVPAETKSLQQKRKRDDTDLCTSFDNSLAKRICVNVDKELTDSVKNSELPDPENSPASTSRVSPLTKRKRDDEEESGSCETSPHKRRRENLSEGGEGANQT